LIETLGAGLGLDALDLGYHVVQRRRHGLVHLFRIIALDKVRPVTVAPE
jgi:hypothetical protein